ncbi:hypothetical protein CYL20_10315 [Pseudomonas palleroniana]|uniref:Uncharacterized protein n=1 Tax=Pseudomonas palleroniana TaxID=191390 RepID=A0A2L1JJ11_9PSED|nr:hypothetical protein CYL20_10315 [Pseudomonas palleroniana]
MAINLWRASLLALGCEAAPIQPTYFFRWSASPGFGAASRPSASKLARHNRNEAVNLGQRGVCL